MDDLVPPSHISRHKSAPATAGSTFSHFNVLQLHQQSDIRHRNCPQKEHRGLTKDMNQTEIGSSKDCVNISISDK